MEISFARIALLMKKQFIENKKFYLFSTLAMMGIMGFIFSFLVINNDFQLATQGMCLGMGIVSFGCLFALTLFSKLDKKKGRMQMLTLPSSSLEQLLCAIIYGSILFPIVYLITVYPILRFANYIDSIYAPVNQAYIFNVKGLHELFLSIFYVLQTLVLLFSVFIRQYKVPLSAAVLSFLFFGTIYFYPKVMVQFLPYQFNKEIKTKQPLVDGKYSSANKNPVNIAQTFNQIQATPFGTVVYHSGSSATRLQLNLPSTQQGIFGMLLLLSIPFMWLIIWFRLKESELR